MAAGAGALKEAVDKAEKSFAEEAQRVHYMSVPPNAALSAIKMLSEADLAGGSRIIMEKPFGTDLESAVALNDALHKVFAEDQIFRIDHFLGKEPAQNILAFRFGNGLFEPIWNRNFIDHVQIDVPETLDIGNRIGFYEQTGAYRDMVVTHLFQILGFMAMEPPTSLAPGPISEEKNKVFRSLMPIDPSHVVRGQFIGYRKEPGVDPGIRHRDLHRAQMPDRQLALGGRAFLLAHRQAHGGRPAHHFDRLPRTAEEHVPGGFRRWLARAGSPDIRSRRSVEGVAVFLRQEARAGDAAQQAEPAVRDSRHRIAAATCSRPTSASSSTPCAAITRCSVRPRASSGCGKSPSRFSQSPPPVKVYAPGTWGPQAIYQLIAPHAWRLPFERAWREGNVASA